MCARTGGGEGPSELSPGLDTSHSLMGGEGRGGKGEGRGGEGRGGEGRRGEERGWKGRGQEGREEGRGGENEHIAVLQQLPVPRNLC